MVGVSAEHGGAVWWRGGVVAWWRGGVVVRWCGGAVLRRARGVGRGAWGAHVAHAIDGEAQGDTRH